MTALKKIAKDTFEIAGLMAIAWLIGFSLMSGSIVAASYHGVAVVIGYEEGNK